MILVSVHQFESRIVEYERENLKSVLLLREHCESSFFQARRAIQRLLCFRELQV